jgi:hypothetical protein
MLIAHHSTHKLLYTTKKETSERRNTVEEETRKRRHTCELGNPDVDKIMWNAWRNSGQTQKLLDL